MTREEAIYYLEKIKQEYDCSYEEDALDMAIQTLVIIDKIEPMFGDMLDIPTQELMRDATPEEREAIDKYIKSISKPTGIEFDKEQEPETGHCKDCKYFEYDSVAKVDGIPLIVAHEICLRWGDGCKTKESGYCFLFEPQESEVDNG